jgi:hypothetical protein
MAAQSRQLESASLLSPRAATTAAAATPTATTCRPIVLWCASVLSAAALGAINKREAMRVRKMRER